MEGSQECSIAQKPSSAVTAHGPTGPCPWISTPQGRNPLRALPLQPPGEPPCRGGLTRLAEITAVIMLSSQCITVIAVINSLNNSKGNDSNNNSTDHSTVTTRCSNTTTNSETPSRAREPKRRTRAPQGSRSALFISITTN